MRVRVSFLGSLAAFLAATATAGAAPIELGALTQGFFSQQDSPCFLGASCGPNEGLPYTNISGADQAIQDSPEYTLSQLTAAVGQAPLIAIDFNQTGSDRLYRINYIRILINGAIEFQFSGASTLPQINVGNGESDYTIAGLDFSGFDPASTVRFRVSFGNPDADGKGSGDNNSGFETYFLVSGTDAPLPGMPLPEPATLALLGVGLAAVAIRRRRRR